MLRRAFLIASLLLVWVDLKAEITSIIQFPTGGNYEIQFSSDGLFGSSDTFKFVPSSGTLQTPKVQFGDGSVQTTAYSTSTGFGLLTATQSWTGGNTFSSATITSARILSATISTTTISSATITSLHPGVVLSDNGTESNPSLSFLNLTGNGFYVSPSNSNALNIVQNQTAQITIADDTFSITPNASTISMQANLDLNGYRVKWGETAGIYNVTSAPQSLNFLISGSTAVIVSSTSVSIPDGTSNVPSVTFNNDANTGFFRPTADSVGVAVGGSGNNHLEIRQNAQVSISVLDSGRTNFFPLVVDASTITLKANGVHETYSNSVLVQNITAAGEITRPLQPSFLVTDPVGATDITGDGSVYQVSFGTEVYDQGGDIANSTFTAPVTGRYLLCASALLTGLGALHTRDDINIVTSNRSYRQAFIWTAGSVTAFVNQRCVVADMDANDIASVTITGIGSTKTGDIGAAATDNNFSGSLIN